MEKFNYSVCGALNCQLVQPVSKQNQEAAFKPVKLKVPVKENERGKPWSAFGEWYWI